MEAINSILSAILPYTEWVMLFLIVGGGIFLTLYSRLTPFRYFYHAIAITAGKYDDDKDPGEVSHFKALSSAVAATVGMGNIAGVAIAIYQGGPGVVFWIWMTALIGMAIKYYSCSLSIMFRGTDSSGAIQGGPMYYILEGLGKKAKPLAIFFAVAGLFGALPAFTTNQFTQTLMDVIVPQETIFVASELFWKTAIGLLLSIITSIVIFGGLKKISNVASTMVPFMVVLYLVSVSMIIGFSTTSLCLPSSLRIIKTGTNRAPDAMANFTGAVAV